MVFSYNWLQSFFRKKLPKPETLADLLTMHSFEVGEVKKRGKDWALDIDVLSNRGPDCFSHLGIAREIAAITGFAYRESLPIIKEDKDSRIRNFLTLEVKDRSCLRYTARVLTHVKVGSSPRWLKERLQTCGVGSINNIVDIANYVMLETGQPLHAFDYNKLALQGKAKKIIVRKAKKGERIITLDGEKYDLDKDILVIADNKTPLAIAGIKGGRGAEIDNKTKIVVLESANFDQRSIRSSSKKLGLRSDASWRFEHGPDPNLTETALDLATALLQKLASGKVAQGVIDFYPKKVFPKKIRLELKYVERLLGVRIPEREIKRIFKNLGFKILPERSGTLAVMVPTFRRDLSLPEDLIEEIGRIYGYEKIKAVFPKASLIPPKRNETIFREEIAKNILKEAGLSEVYNYSFLSEKKRRLFGYRSSELIEVINPISQEQEFLRPSLIPNVLGNIRENGKYFDEIKIFEIGRIFRKPKIEKRMLSGAIAQKDSDPNLFYSLKGIIDLLLRKLGISTLWYDSYKATPKESKISLWHPKKSAQIKVDHQVLGFLGEVSPKIIQELKLPKGVVIFDIDFEKLAKITFEEEIYQPLSRFPAVIRDLAVLVPQGVLVIEVLNRINSVAGPLVKDVDLFDMYGGQGIIPGKKNLAFHIIYQAKDKTLTSKEVDQIHQKIIKALEKDPEWEVRN